MRSHLDGEKMRKGINSDGPLNVFVAGVQQ